MSSVASGSARPARPARPTRVARRRPALLALLDRPLTKRAGGGAGGALGAARLAWLADGGRLEDVCAKQPVIEAFEPQPERRSALMDRYARFRALYPLLKDSFGAD